MMEQQQQQQQQQSLEVPNKLVDITSLVNNYYTEGKTH